MAWLLSGKDIVYVHEVCLPFRFSLKREFLTIENNTGDVTQIDGRTLRCLFNHIRRIAFMAGPDDYSTPSSRLICSDLEFPTNCGQEGFHQVAYESFAAQERGLAQ